jgi:SAM-dependent methyltransferase
MLYRSLPPALRAASPPTRPPCPHDRRVGGAGGWGRLVWLRGQRAEGECPVCSNNGPHRLVLTVPSSIAKDLTVTFARCRRCDCKFVLAYQSVAYEEAPASDAPLRFYVEQGARLDFLARSIFVAAQAPVRNYLDIGCGFGFGPDMATRIFGWNAVGLDPGALAAAGRNMLDVGIESEILTAETRLADAPFDAIVAMEVIEHIVEPHSFIRAIRTNLADDGMFILSTPNGRYLDTCPNGDMLLPILSPGYHAVLYSAGGLTALLEGAGFQNVKVVQSDATLFAVASPSDRPLHTETPINQADYIGYIRSRFRDAPAGSPVHIGFGHRLLRSLIKERSYDQALDVFAEVNEALLAHLGIDLTKPLDIASRVQAETIGFAEIPTKYPFCLAGLLLGRGNIAAHHERNIDIASCYFLAARLSAQMLLGALNAIGISDGELAVLPTLATDALVALFRKNESAPCGK